MAVIISKCSFPVITTVNLSVTAVLTGIMLTIVMRVMTAIASLMMLGEKERERGGQTTRQEQRNGQREADK